MGKQILPLGENMGKLEKLLPLDVAAERLGLSVETLTGLIDSGTIKAMTRQGETLVPESEIGKITRDKFKRLKGKEITANDAVEKYQVPYTTLIGWVHSPVSLITIIKPGYGMLLDEADVAYCASVYKARGRSSRTFDSAGRPYQLVRPELAEYRKRKAKQEQATA